MSLDSVIIEDLKVAADYLLRCCEKSGRVNVKGHFPNVASALEFLDNNTVDLLFLDVEMPGATGFDLLDKIAYKPMVILTTSKEKYAFNAFEYHVTDFLKKPFTYNRFIEAINKAEQSLKNSVAENQAAEYIFIRSEGKLVRLRNDDILYVEAADDYVWFVTAGQKYLTKNTIRNLEEKLNPSQFMKIHRKYIINVSKIEDILESEVVVNNTRLPLGKNTRADVMKRMTIL
jgi:DNA-binding LytR/AlgR family response regulator